MAQRETEKKEFHSRRYTIELFVVCLYANVKLLNMITRRELCLQEKINLIKEKENVLSYGQISDKFQISVGAVSNISKRKLEYTDDYELNRN